MAKTDTITVRNNTRRLWFFELKPEDMKAARKIDHPGLHVERNYLVLGDKEAQEGEATPVLEGLPRSIWDAVMGFAVPQAELINKLIADGDIQVSRAA